MNLTKVIVDPSADFERSVAGLGTCALWYL